MRLKMMPLPALKYTKVLLNPKIESVVELAIPCMYTYEGDDITCYCPRCHEELSNDFNFHSHLHKFGTLRTIVKWYTCPLCSEVYYRISLTDMLKMAKRDL